MLRDNLASSFKIQNASTNVTYGPKKDKNLTICSNLSILSITLKNLLNSYTWQAYFLFGIETSAL